MNGKSILEMLIAYKNTVKKKINSDNSIIKNELYEAKIVEVEIIIDKIKYIQLGKSADWEKILDNTNSELIKIKESKNLEELILGLYDSFFFRRYQPSLFFSIYNDDEVDYLVDQYKGYVDNQYWEKSDEQINGILGNLIA
tara:strand:- start:80 stop:502 length:423 start_codon:yes stop_codon:yes gene_type:complete